MPIRITGMNSGLDTESIISELVKAKSAKKDTLVKNQTKLQWKQDAWKDLNKKVYSFYSKTLSNMRFSSDYAKKNTKVSNPNVASVITGGNAVNGVQTLQIDKLAKTGYLTGAELQKDGSKANYTAGTKLTDMGVEAGSEFTLTVKGKSTTISVGENTTVSEFTAQLQNAGINASFDAKNQRFFLSAKTSGAANDFSLTANTEVSQNGLAALGLNAAVTKESADYKYYKSLKDSISDADGNLLTGEELTAKVKELTQKQVENELASLVKQYNSYQTSLNKNKEGKEKAEEELAKLKESRKDDDSFNTISKEGLEELKKKEPQKPGEEATDADKEAYETAKKAFDEKVADYEKMLSYQSTIDSYTELEGKLAETGTKLNLGDAAKEDETGLIKEGAKLESSYETEFTNKVVDAYIAKAQFAADTVDAVDAGGAAPAGVNQPTRVTGQDSQILLNGAMFTSTSNTFEINGLTITANAETTEAVTLTTADDTDGIYDMIKNFFKEYNELINEMDKLYNAESSKGYDPLTDEEKDSMSDKEVEKWEEKIKDSILRRDSTLGTVSGAMKQILLAGVKMADGSRMSLSDFGINTLGYFNAADNEKNAYHIDGDKDDTNTGTNADKLKTMIANSPEKVVEFFSGLAKNLYTEVGDLMKGTEYSSSFTLYDDKSMKSEYDDYKSKITAQEEKITAFEDRYYKKFSKMETAMAKMQSKQNALSGFFGG